MFQYLELLNARVHLFNQVPDAPGETHVEGWLLWMERSKFHMEEDRDGCVSFQHFQCFCKSHHYLYYWTVEKKKKKDYISMHWPHRKYPGQTLTLFCPLFEPGPTTEHAQYTPPVPERSCSRQGNYEEPVIYLTNGKLAIKGIDCTSFSQHYNRPSVSRQCTQTWQRRKKKKKQLESTSNNIESDIWSTHWTLIKLILQKDGVGIGKPTFHL